VLRPEEDREGDVCLLELEVRRPEELRLDEDTRSEEEPRLLPEEERDEEREGEM